MNFDPAPFPKDHLGAPARPQTDLLECPVFEVFYGGARGGGKTESSIGDWLQHSSPYGEHAIGIFVRRKLTQLSEVIARTKQLFPLLGAKYNEQQKTWSMANGARLKFVYLERDSDAEEYQGHSYTRIYVEELTNFPLPGPIDKLRATLRSGAGVPVGMRLTGNTWRMVSAGGGSTLAATSPLIAAAGDRLKIERNAAGTFKAYIARAEAPDAWVDYYTFPTVYTGDVFVSIAGASAGTAPARACGPVRGINVVEA